MNRVFLASILLSAAACDDPGNITKFDLNTSHEQLLALESRIDALESAPAAAAGQPNQAREKEAFGVYQQVQQALATDNLEGAEQALAKLKTYTDIPPAVQAAQQLEMQIQLVKDQKALIGTEAPALAVDQWLEGSASMGDAKVNVLVFWEVWCPHCKREVPELEKRYQSYKAKNASLNVIGLTQLSRDKSVEEVKGFLSDNKVTYPVAKVNAAIPEHYKVQGIPAAAVVVDGKITWSGHPKDLTDEMLDAWLNG